jgi:hypothetical protein
MRGAGGEEGVKPGRVRLRRAEHQQVRDGRDLIADRADRAEIFVLDDQNAGGGIVDDPGELGRREAALAATEEAVDIRRALAAARPDAIAHRVAAGVTVHVVPDWLAPWPARRRPCRPAATLAEARRASAASRGMAEARPSAMFRAAWSPRRCRSSEALLPNTLYPNRSMSRLMSMA